MHAFGNHTIERRYGTVGAVVACAFAILLFQVFAVHAVPAYASTLTTASASANTVVIISAKEQKAYDRAVAACMDYKNQPNPIVVDMSDLGLTAKQALNVGEMLHSNGELFWVNTYDDNSFGRKSFSLPCYYSDAKITSMRSKLDVAAQKALAYIGPGMSAATKVHMLHDYLINNVSYVSKQKTAYTGLVQGKADCFGYALSMDVLLRRAGFSTDMAFNERLDHAWNVVKVGKYWYHVDVTFGKSLSGKRISDYFNWKGKICHIYLLQSDTSMNSVKRDAEGYTIGSNTGWTCHHRCTDKTYDGESARGPSGSLGKHCSDYKSIVRTFTSAGLKYAVTGVKKAKVSAVTGKAQLAASKLTIPAAVTYKGVTYSVRGMARGAFSKAKAKTLSIGTAALTSSGVKGSLNNSKVTRVELLKTAKSKKSAYAKYFAKANSGKQVTVAIASSAKGTQALKFATPQSKTVAYGQVKSKALTVAVSKATGGKTAVRYAIASYGSKKAESHLSMTAANEKAGKITVAKGTPRGKYKVTVKATAVATDNWNAKSKSATVTIQVR